MTTKQINLMDKKPVHQIEKGTIVKKSGDMFIVSKISEAQFTSVVDDALFSPRYSQNNYHATSALRRQEERNGMAVRNPSEAKYVLISLSTGMKFYPEFLTLQELLMRMTRAGFEIVNSIEIKELS
jgi:hypothetical protein